MADPIDLDTSRPFRNLARLRELIEYILNTHRHNETIWLEWKCGLDLSKPAGRFAVAKQVLGFANREPNRAATYAEGCAFVVLGAEPGNLEGQASLDPSEFEAGITPYLGSDGPDWLPQTVELHGKAVVVVTIEPPRWGDRIHALRRDYTPSDGNGARNGTVFVRRPGGTHQASSEEIRMLERRLLSQAASGLGLVLQAVNEPLPRAEITGEALDAWIQAERQRLLRPLEEEEARKAAEARAKELNPVQWASRIQADFLRNLAPLASEIAENRTPTAYREEVEKYLKKLRPRLVSSAINEFEDRVRARLLLRVVNTTDRNLEAVEVRVDFSGPVMTAVYQKVEMPPAPRPWGPRTNSLLGSVRMPTVPPNVLPRIVTPRGYSASNKGSTSIEFDPVHLSPRKEKDLVPVPLIVSAPVARELTGTWTATARNRDGQATGTVAVPLSEQTIPVSQLLDPPG